MSMSAATAGSNHTALIYIAHKLGSSGKINSRLKILIGRLIEINCFEEIQSYVLLRKLLEAIYQWNMIL